MITVTSDYAAAHLDELLEGVARGESVLIARHGQPVARLMRVHPEDDEAHVPVHEVDEAFHGD
jgi:prevent-host-death family protein